MFLWTQFDATHPMNQGLAKQDNLDLIDGIICVSDWQRSALLSKFNIPRDKLAVRFDAIDPAFENLFSDGKEFVHYKAKSPLFAYLEQTTFGLEILLDHFPDVINVYPTATLNIYDPAPEAGIDPAANEKILTLAAQTKNVHHLINISNTELAARLRTHTLFAYPNMLEQTSCTPMLNAMAAGLYVITSNMGALPEYSVEHGKCILAKNLQSDSLDSFIGQVLAVCQSQSHTPSSFYDYCYKQVLDVNNKHTWSVRAREWVNLLSGAT